MADTSKAALAGAKRDPSEIRSSLEDKVSSLEAKIIELTQRLDQQTANN
jgi:uncharacterized protein YceH (UPF0502 family)